MKKCKTGEKCNTLKLKTSLNVGDYTRPGIVIDYCTSALLALFLICQFWSLPIPQQIEI